MLPATCSVTRKRLNIKHLAKIRVVVFATLKTPKTLVYSRLRAAPNVRAHLSSIIFTLLPATPRSTCHSTFASVTPRSHRSLHAPTSHFTLPPVTPRSHQSLHARICHSTLPPASPLSPLHAHRRYPHVHIEVQPELGIAPWLQLDFVDVRHSGERPLGCFPVPAFESLFNRTERSSCECGSGAAE